MLPNRTSNFFIDSVGEITTQAYKGDFTVKTILTIGEKIELETEKTKLSSDLVNVSPELKTVSTILAELKVRVIESPNWWKESNNGKDLLDDNVIFDIYSKVIDAVNDWNNTLATKAGKKIETGSGSQNPPIQS